MTPELETNQPKLLEHDVLTIDADGLGRVEIIGARARMIFFEFQIVGGILVKMPVICIKRQVATLDSVSVARWEAQGIIIRRSWAGNIVLM